MKIKALLPILLLSFYNTVVFANCPNLVPDSYFCSYQSGDNEVFWEQRMYKQEYTHVIEEGVPKLYFGHTSDSIDTRLYDLSTGKLTNPIDGTVAKLSCDGNYLTETLYSNKDGLRKMRLRQLSIDKYEAHYTELKPGDGAPSTEIRMSCRLDSSEPWLPSMLNDKEKDKIRKKIELVLNQLYSRALSNTEVLNLTILRVEEGFNNYKFYTHYQIKSDKGPKADQYRIIYVREDKNGYTVFPFISPLTALVNDDIAKQYGDLDKACDTLAEHPLDPNKKGRGVAWEALDPTAYEICRKAVVAAKANVKNKTRYQWLRVQDKIGDTTLSSDYKTFEKTTIFPVLIWLGNNYPMAYFSAAMLAGDLRDNEKKYHLLERAKQIPASFTYRAFMLLNNEYNDTNSTQEKYEKIYNLYLTAAQLGDVTAKELLAEAKLYGYFYQEKDEGKGLGMLEELAKQGNEEAILELAKYEDKYLDSRRAFKLLKPLAMRGNLNAIHQLIPIVVKLNDSLLSERNPSKSTFERNHQTLNFISAIYRIGIKKGDDKSRIALAGLPLLYPKYYDGDTIVPKSLLLLDWVFDKNYYATRDWVKINLLISKTKLHNPQQVKKLLRRLANRINWMEKTEFRNLVTVMHPELVKPDSIFEEGYDFDNMSEEKWRKLRDKLTTEIKTALQSIQTGS